MLDDKNNTGEENTGHWNSGDCNSGHCNSGRWNSGNCNSGDWNSGRWNSGFFNTDEPYVRMFNHQTNMKRKDIDFPDWFFFELTEWIDSENMTEEEKQQYPEHETTGGHLKVYDYKEAWRNAFDEETDLDEIRKAEQLPNFDYDIFEEITGISKSDFDKKLGRSNTDEKDNKPKYIKIDGVEYRRVN